jgi:hypothetical protein
MIISGVQTVGEDEAEECLAIDGRISNVDNFNMNYASYL